MAHLLLLLPCLWFALAYAGLPRLWSHHEHKLKAGREEIVSHSAQDIPGDPINLALVLSVDEKSQIQALDREQPVLPMMPGVPERRTHTGLIRAAVPSATAKIPKRAQNAIRRRPSRSRI